MKKVSLILLVVMLFTLACKKKEEFKSYFNSSVEVLDADSLLPNYTFKPISDADIAVYKNESDFLANKNAYVKGKSDERGIFEIYFGQEERHFWLRVKKGNLNNYRYKRFYTKNMDQWSGGSGGRNCPDENKCTTSVRPAIFLSTTPTRLQLKVFDNGKVVPGAKVQMYLNESDYNRNVIPDSGEYKKYKTYLNKTPEFYDVLEKQTDLKGEVMFENFEPRKYWFSVTKDGKSNASTTFNTNEPLPDDVNVTTVLDIGIK